MEHARRGDAIVVAKADRVCHCVNDLLHTLEYFAESGVGFHVAGDELDASGLPIARLFAVFREFESARISQQR